jgi:osomolarity two-component system, response regulator SKN7
MHLKVIQQMSKVPRSIGIPPLSDTAFEEAFTSQASSDAEIVAASTATSGSLVPIGSGNIVLGDVGGVVALDEDGRINPLAGMGLSDEQYVKILQNLVSGEVFPGMMGGVNTSERSVGGGKRALDDHNPGDGREGKRSRFELVE